MNDMISGLSNMYTNGAYSSATENLKDKLGTTDYSKATDEELMEACKTFESYFIEQAIKGMEKTIPDNDDSSASYLNMFKDTLYQEYADIASERGDGIGIAKMLYEQMKRNYNIKPSGDHRNPCGFFMFEQGRRICRLKVTSRK